ncbi:MAG: STAS domain-containing protein [Candidatus Binatia bacterium]
MLRITENLENGKTLRLRLDGTISLETFDELEKVCERHQQGNGYAVIVDMAGVIFMNDAAAKKLARLRCDSLRIINCSPFTAALLNVVEDLD